ncbi:MAG: hypothetical protein JF588_11290 [Caulobacterales bacterium]|nr:hypothetical protein [Caulobacterales bacterium]
MAWRKLGLVYRPPGTAAWALTNAAYPTAEVVAEDRLRIYFTSLDANNFGRGGWLEVDPTDPCRVLELCDGPILDIGDPGDFDDCGANPFSVLTFQGRRLMYYQGWQRGLRTPFAAFTGLAVGDAAGRFTKWARVPILDRTDEEPHIRGAPCVLDCGDHLRMWYVASSRWSEGPAGLHYFVTIRHATSTDGITWTTTPGPCLTPEDDEYAVGRPWVVRDGALFRMWYAIRSLNRPYAIGYAESDDGLTWRRQDDRAGIARSAEGWDSEMICFPNVVDAGGRRLLFYNGNRHGASGFGCAEWVADA